MIIQDYIGNKSKSLNIQKKPIQGVDTILFIYLFIPVFCLMCSLFAGRKSSVIPKPQPYSESERKAILMESKTKFKTKNFWNDASMFMPNE